MALTLAPALRQWEQYPPVRMVSVMPLAALVTLSLFLLMRAMIATQFSYDDIATQPGSITLSDFDFYFDGGMRNRKTTFKRAKDVTPPPPAPRLSSQSAQQPSGALASEPLLLPRPDAHSLASGKALVFADRDVQPLIRTAPLYPRRAAQHDLEGTCTGIFDVNAEGVPYHIRVSCSSPVFVGAAKRAIENWRYIPGINNGVTVPRRGLHVPFRFRMGQD